VTQLRSGQVPLVSVVIPAYKRPELLRKAVLAVFDQDLPKEQYELLVVDSSPDDRNIALLEQLSVAAPCAFRSFTKTPEGPGPSRGLGVQHARGRFIAFTDSDCQPSRSWLRTGLAAFEEGIGLVQGRTAPDPTAACRVLSWYVSVEHETFIYECCNIFYRREALLQAGSFLPGHLPRADYPLGGEDLDMAWRVKRHGWQSRFVPEAVVYHEVVPISVRRWLVNERLFMWPLLLRRFPELRPFFYRRYFYDEAQACFLAAVIGLSLAALHPAWLMLGVPYALLRGSQATATLKGLLRPLRIPAYFARDAIAFLVLLGGSLRFRTVLL
jgi:glycosyltransferase involved in cell wall biosynthesis